MPRKIPQPEDEWRGASLEQVADLRAWVLLRMSERHADNVAAWLLALQSDELRDTTARQLGFYRAILEEYGAPRPVAPPSGATQDTTDVPGDEERSPEAPCTTGSSGSAPSDRLRRAP